MFSKAAEPLLSSAPCSHSSSNSSQTPVVGGEIVEEQLPALVSEQQLCGPPESENEGGCAGKLYAFPPNYMTLCKLADFLCERRKLSIKNETVLSYMIPYG